MFLSPQKHGDPAPQLNKFDVLLTTNESYNYMNRIAIGVDKHFFVFLVLASNHLYTWAKHPLIPSPFCEELLPPPPSTPDSSVCLDVVCLYCLTMSAQPASVRLHQPLRPWCPACCSSLPIFLMSDFVSFVRLCSLLSVILSAHLNGV